MLTLVAILTGMALCPTGLARAVQPGRTGAQRVWTALAGLHVAGWLRQASLPLAAGALALWAGLTRGPRHWTGAEPDATVKDNGYATRAR